jgi:multiple sugar transport system permease protein
MVPAMTLLIPQYLIMDRLNLLNTYWPLWLLSMFSSFGIFLWGQYMHGIPVALYESAKLGGAGDFTIYRRIILPLYKPVIALQTTSTFLGTFNAFLWPVLVLNEEQRFTLPIFAAKGRLAIRCVRL